MAYQKLIMQEQLAHMDTGARMLQGDQELVAYPENSTIRVWHGVVPDRYAKHWHSAVEVVMTLEGVVNMNVSGEEYAIHAGEIIIVPSDMVHDLRMSKGGKRDLMLFELDSILILRDFYMINSMMDKPVLLRQDSPLIERVRTLLISVRDEYASGNNLKNMMSYAYILQMYALIGRDYLDTIYQDRKISHIKQQAYWAVMNRVMEHVDHHYMDDLSLDDIAAQAGFSKYHFCRVFKQYTNNTFYHYLCHKRVVMAEKQLNVTGRSISEIALQVGFDSISSFNRVYKQIRGTTPSQYRALYHHKRMDETED